MADFSEVLLRYGKSKELSAGEILFQQGSVSDGVYYLKSGRLGAYREEQEALYPLSEILPGNLVGELGSATGWSRTATVKALEDSLVVHISEDDFQQSLDESPALAAAVVCQLGERLTHADVARVSLGRSYQQAMGRVQTVCSEMERLEELLRLREELADMIVHDLRNPLGVVISGLQLLEHTSTPESQDEYVSSVLGTMGRSVRRMQHLVDTLLDIARLQGGEMDLRRAPLDLNVLVGELIAEEGPLAEGRQVTLEACLPEGLPAVLADRDVLLRVLANLFDNALKFTPAEGRVWVEARAGADEVRVEVLDTGPGIPVAERERIFEKFTQVQGRAGRQRGSGLGLAFCRMAIEAHGGRIWVEDGPGGVGSRFVLTLSRASEEAGAGLSG